jgi:2-polyprenyl-6-methoxyphenol hydroxylase-like FAD-dependent oxidoreductase
VLLDEPDDGTGGRPEVLHGDLRRILIDSLPDDMIQWGRKVADVQPLGDGPHELTFPDGPTVTTSRFVGADGAWSRAAALRRQAGVRRLVVQFFAYANGLLPPGRDCLLS